MPEANIPSLFTTVIVDGKEQPPNPMTQALFGLLFMQAFRPDRVPSAAHQYVSAVFGGNFTAQCEQEIDLATIVENEIKASEPVLLCCVTGYDASNRVDDLAMYLNKQITSIAIGSAEGFSQVCNKN